MSGNSWVGKHKKELGLAAAVAAPFALPAAASALGLGEGAGGLLGGILGAGTGAQAAAGAGDLSALTPLQQQGMTLPGLGARLSSITPGEAGKAALAFQAMGLNQQPQVAPMSPMTQMGPQQAQNMNQQLAQIFPTLPPWQQEDLRRRMQQQSLLGGGFYG